jgi:osmoprotectant transport system substrate-binding protein
MIRSHQKRFIAALAAMTAVITACGSSSSGQSGSGGGPLTIAVKDFSENSLLGDMAKLLLEKKGYTVTLKQISGNTSIRDGLTSKQYDGYFEYLGTGLEDVHKYKTPIGDPQKAVDKLNELDGPNSIVWVDPTPKFNDPDVLTIRQTDVSTYGSTMTALAAYANAHKDLRFCLQDQFMIREAGYKALVNTYGFPPQDQIKLTQEKESIALQDLAAKPSKCDVSQGFGTDPHIDTLSLQVVKDDKHALPFDGFALSILKSTLDAHPNIKDIIKPMTDIFTTADSKDLQKQVDVDKKDEIGVAKAYLKSKGLLS